MNRRDRGVERNTPLESGGVLVAEQVPLELETSAIRAGTEG